MFKLQLNTKSSIVFLIIIVFTFIIGRQFFTNSSEIIQLETEKRAAKLLKPNDWQYRQRAYPTGKIDKKAYLNAVSYRANHFSNAALTENLSENPWIFAGPTNIGGRITDIEMPLSGMAIYAGAASGGIFKSEDTGNSWTAIFDSAMNLSIGDMALAPSNEDIIYVGTGEPNAGGGSLAYDGVGVYRSDNAGQSWNHIGLMDVGSIGKVVIDSDDPNVAYVGAMGNLFENNNERGVFRTKDGGSSWEKVLYINDSTGVVDMAINPDQPDTLYAAGWERVRRPDRRNYGGPSSAIYRSMDGGDTWQKLTNGLPASAGRIGISIAASDPAILYAFHADPITGGILGVYKTTNHGDSWTSLNTTGISDVPYIWWFGRIFVDPTDADKVYVASFNMHKSIDGGNTWSNTFSGVHVDQHAIFIHPQAPSLVLNGNDGGVYISTNGGDSYTHSNKLPISQFYTCEIDYSVPNRLYGGTQDNSSVRTLSGIVDNWERIFVGDGFQTLVDPINNNYVYTESQYGNFVKSTNGGTSWYSGLNGIGSGDRKNWNTPVIFHPTNPATLYYGSNFLYKSTDRADSWTAISPDLTKGAGTGNLTFGTLTTISVSAADDKVIYVGTDDGNVQVTTNEGTNWTLVSNSLPDRWVTSVVADSNDANIGYVTFSGYRYGSDDGHIFRTTDQGVNWTDITGDLPDIPVNDLIVMPQNDYLYAATDIGVFYSTNLGVNWELLGKGLPNVVITDLDYHPPSNTLVAASYGRGMFRISLEEEVAAGIGEEFIHSISLKAYPNPVKDQLTIEFESKHLTEYVITLINLSGVELLKMNKRILSRGKQRVLLNTSDFPAGIYFVNIFDENNSKFGSISLLKE